MIRKSFLLLTILAIAPSSWSQEFSDYQWPSSSAESGLEQEGSLTSTTDSEILETVEPEEALVPASTMDFLYELQTRLGMNPPELLTLWDFPTRVFPWESDGLAFVVLQFLDFKQAFFLDNRAWMFRFDSRFSGQMGELKMGLSSQTVSQMLGMEIESSDWVQPMDFPGYPVFLRLIFEDDRLVDLYLYRGDY